MSTRPGRRPLGSDTRAEIEAAARHLFTDSGYQGTSIRAIAREAGVDPKMIGYFYGSKQELFVSVMQIPNDQTPQGRSIDKPSGLRIAQHILQIQADPAARQVFVGLIRAAATEPMAARALHDRVLDRILSLVGDELDEPRELRASLMAAQVVGLFMARNVVELQPLQHITDRELAENLAPIFDHLLNGVINQ